VASPLLANIYLHYAFDLWAERWRRREATGNMIVVRYADDIVVGFEHEADARRFWEAMRERLEEFSLSLHPEKTRLIEFGRFAATNRKRRGLGKPETFNFLGFTFICGRNSRGKFLLCRKTRRDRLRARLLELKEELRRRMHQPIPEQEAWLKQVVAGYFAYHAVPTNGRTLRTFRSGVEVLWMRSLRKRSQRDRTTWDKMKKLSEEALVGFRGGSRSVTPPGLREGRRAGPCRVGARCARTGRSREGAAACPARCPDAGEARSAAETKNPRWC